MRKRSDPTYTFKIFAPLLKTTIGPDGKKRLHGVASSTVTDRHGDEMTVTALSDMERSAAQNMTIFMNHSYLVPEDVAGSVERASLSRSAQDPDIHDLSLDIVINEANERAVKAWEAIESGTKLGLSIGAMIPDGGATRNKDTGAYTIDHVELLETSLVGVPANPRSWVEYAVKALNAEEPATTTYDDAITWKEVEDEVCPKCNDRRRRKKDNDCDDAFHGFSPEIAEAEEAEKEAEVPYEDEGLPDPDIEPEVEITSTAASALPEEAEAPDQAEDATEPEVEIASTSAADPEKTDATVEIETEHAKVRVDTGNRGKTPDGASQEAQESVPENEEKADSPWAEIGLTGEPIEGDDLQAALKILEPTVTASLKNSADLLAALTSELVAAREDREEAIRDAADAMRLAKDVLDRVAETPAGRRAVVPAEQKRVNDGIGSLGAVYGPEFVEALRKEP